MESNSQGFATLKRSQPFRALLLTFVLQGLATDGMLAGAQYVATWVLRDEAAVTFLFVALIGSALIFVPIWTAGETTGMAPGATVLTLRLWASGYVESVAGQTVTQQSSAINGIIMSFSIVPAVIIALSLLSFRRYPLREDDLTHGTPRTAPTATEGHQP